MITFLNLNSAAAQAETRCEFLAQVAASEEAILGFDEFQSAALLEKYFWVSREDRLAESFLWHLPADGMQVHVATEFNGKECEILEAYAVNVK